MRGSAAPCGTMGQGNAWLPVPWMVPDFEEGNCTLMLAPLWEATEGLLRAGDGCRKKRPPHGASHAAV
jgi:hypothetical protein